ncbi:MAG: 2OG-Fe(II) oxygenase [Actinomycetota bacterium]
MTVNGAHVREAMPWLWDLYHHEFLDLAKQASGHDVFCATRDQIKVNLNVQVGRNMRYECHVDSNPLEGLLYLTTHPPGAGGELVVANHKGATSVEAVDADCTVIHPLAGNLVFFDARHHPHYVRSLRDDDSVRIVAAMNYYTEECDESKRPIDLDQHLFGESKEEATGA